MLKGARMKLEILIEDGKPLIVFSQEINRDKTINCCSQQDGHTQATRGYLRTLPAPQTREEIRAAWRALKWYASIDE